jgi:intein/homing endonuclease
MSVIAEDIYSETHGSFTVEGYLEEWDRAPAIPDVSDWEFEQVTEAHQPKLQLLRSQFIEESILVPNPNTRELQNFSFKERPYLRRIYDSSAKRKLIVAGRQVEKTVVETALLLTASGARVPIKDVQVGDWLACLDTQEMTPGVEEAPGSRMTESEVVWKSQRYQKPCICVSTRQGHVAEMATTHPVRVWGGWRPAGDLRVGDRVAVVRRAGVFYDEEQPEARIKLTAYMIGDGCCRSKGLRFTNASFLILDDFVKSLASVGMTYRVFEKKGTTALDLGMPRKSAGGLYSWLEQDALLGTNSYTKFVPDWAFRLSQKSTVLFLNRLWATDGYVKKRSTNYDIEYCSVSSRLILDVQALLWKFGIPSRIRQNWPNIYKRRGEEKYAYILRVETQEGVCRFLRDVGALGKSEGIPLPTSSENNNRDTLPPEAANLIQAIAATRRTGRGIAAEEYNLYQAGLRLTPKYPLTQHKLREYLQYFRRDVRYDQKLVDILEAHVDSDIFWDRIVAIEDIGEQWCYDLTVADHHNFIADGLVTHNSSTLGNLTLADCCLIPHFKVLYVSPSSTQTKVFSKDRLKEPIEICPVLRAWFPGRLTDNVYEKKALNRSLITLRYAFLNADRTRGIPADRIIIDEFQDVILDNIPVIEECASHSPFKWFIYSGTPKSLDNPIEHYWQTYSTQNEWAVPCERHGTPKNSGTWHWNILGEANIGANGLVCDKCGEGISAAHPLAQWVSLGNPDPKFDVFEGFHIPQLMVPWIDWQDLLHKYNSIPRPKFFNECLGLSYDSGQRPLTREDLISNCDPTMSLDVQAVAKFRQELGHARIYAGIDWGQDSTNSYTVLSLGAYTGGYFKFFFMHRFEGAESEPLEQLKKIEKIIDTFGVSKIGCDYGGGLDRNAVLLRKYGQGKVMRYQYDNPAVFMKYDPKLGRYHVHKAEVMSAIFNAFKKRTVFRTPRWQDFETPFASDCLAIFSEYNETTRMTEYKKSPNTTDDTFHSLLLCFLASMLEFPREDIFVPSAAIDRLNFD